MATQSSTLTVCFTSAYTGDHRVCYRIGNSGGYTCVNVTCLGGGEQCCLDIPITTDDNACDATDYEGYIQALCEDVSSTEGRVPFQINFTPEFNPIFNMGEADSFVFLSGSVITNNQPGQQVGGDTGHVSTLSNTFTYAFGSDFSGAGSLGTPASPGTPLGDQRAVLDNLNALAYDYAYPPGAINLATNITTPSGVANFVPGVYFIDGAASIGGPSVLTFDGDGYYVFIINGALTSVSGSIFSLINGADSGKIFWVPSGGASLGANTQFSGTVLSGAAAITVGTGFFLLNGRLISESAITIAEGSNGFVVSPQCT